MNEDLTFRICEVIASITGVPASVVLEGASNGTIQDLDSLAHVHLIMALEQEFGVSFSVDQALELTSVPAIHAALIDCAPARAD